MMGKPSSINSFWDEGGGKAFLGLLSLNRGKRRGPGAVTTSASFPLLRKEKEKKENAQCRIENIENDQRRINPGAGWAVFSSFVTWGKKERKGPGIPRSWY